MGAFKNILGGIATWKVDRASLPSSKHVKAEPGRLHKAPQEDILKKEEKEEAASKPPNGSLSQGREPMKSPQSAHINSGNSFSKTTNTAENNTLPTDGIVRIHSNASRTSLQRSGPQLRLLSTYEQPCAVCFEPVPPGTHIIRALSSSCQHPAEDPIICMNCLLQYFQANTSNSPNDTIKCWACPVLLTKKDLAQLDPRWSLVEEEEEAGESKEIKVEVDHQPALKAKQMLDAKNQQAARESTDNYYQKFLMANTRQCPGPGCGVRIEKVYGCDHMMCKSGLFLLLSVRRTYLYASHLLRSDSQLVLTYIRKTRPLMQG